MKPIKFSIPMLLVGLLVAAPALAHSQAHEGHHTQATIKEQKPWGIAGDAGEVGRTIEIRMTDQMRFTPDRLQVRQGETIRFVHHNDGKMLHEFVIGTRQTLDEHAAMMLRFPGMEHDEPYMAHVSPGQVGEMIWTFNRAGEFDFACLIAGHYQAGMVGTIHVLAE
ncbi:cupredoxin family protein [Pseudomonas sp. LMG 31766]|uniref:Cupredoxin family protein n=1 Tax=Pseudomonas chaetocerotis TaxID=2758695 RepID=A0A931GDR6_9PSED|nr:cupredoxin family protein [Pseudomonas chaetocerotis]MBZ9664782.1 cupredoxin family protein [Pseudomonas chaetocerotis]